MARKGATAMEVHGDGVAFITISNPPVNALSLDVIDSLQRNYGEALRRNDVKAIVLTGAKGRFSGGFHINAFQNKPRLFAPRSVSHLFGGWLQGIRKDLRQNVLLGYLFMCPLVSHMGYSSEARITGVSYYGVSTFGAGGQGVFYPGSWVAV